MKARIAVVILAIVGLMLPALVEAQGPPPFGGHYPAGVEGIKGGSLPPPGLYLRDYNLFYHANRLPDGPPDPKVTAYVNAPRLIWISDYKILGGYYGADILATFGYVDWELGPTDDDYFGIGDVCVEPITLSWHGKQWDTAVGYAFWAPLGSDNRRDDGRPPLIWKGYWSHMLTAGGTWFPDKAKSWSLSVLNRYEFAHEHSDSGITPGQTWTLEWGIGKSLKPTIEVGAVGYIQKQINDDSGPGASDSQDQIAGVGPEINVMIPKLKMMASLRYLREFWAHDRPEGNTVTLTLTKPF